MRTVSRVAVVDDKGCNGCATCVRICPVEAIGLQKLSEQRVAVVDAQSCLDCTLCVTRCPEHAVRMIERKSSFRVGIDVADVPVGQVAEICRAAHMYPDQVICYCHRVQAKEVAAAILLGAKTPEDVSRATGARTGCGVLCITATIRLLRAAGIELTKASGYQWYGIDTSIWNLATEFQEKYSKYYLAEDFRSMNELFPGGT